jgi:SAM-dependent methyltransferase
MKKNMREIIRKGYEKGDYISAYRMSKEPNRFEKAFMDRLLSEMPEGPKPKVLDLGCGAGIPFDSYLASRGCDITGIDITEKHLALARKNVPKARFIMGDFSRMKLKGKFDAVISFYAIFHIPREEHLRMFKKIKSLLTDGGIALLTLGAVGSGYTEYGNWPGGLMAWDSYDSKTYEEMLKGIGFRVLKTKFEGRRNTPEYHFWILVKKATS